MKAKFINESDFNSIKESDVITDELYKQWKQDDYLDDLFSWEYAGENGMKDISELPEDFLESEEYDDWFKYEMSYRCQETINMFNYDIIIGNELSIYRMIVVNDEWIENLKQGDSLGIYWSYEEDAAEPHWGYNNAANHVLIEALVNVDDINWIKTIQANMHPSYTQEKEIYLDKNTPIKLISIKINGNNYNINKLKNQIFKA